MSSECVGSVWVRYDLRITYARFDEFPVSGSFYIHFFDSSRKVQLTLAEFYSRRVLVILLFTGDGN